MNRVYIIVRYFYPRKTIRRRFHTVLAALVYLISIPDAQYDFIKEIKIEID